MNFAPIDWSKYNKPPFFPQWLSRSETRELARYDDGLRVDIETNVRSMSEQYDIDKVRGVFLDRIGKILAENRNANDDELYRIFLKLRIMLNTTNGSVNDIIKTIKFLYTSEVVKIVSAYPAGIIIEHDGEGTHGLNFNKIIAQVVSAGVDYSTKEIFNFVDEFTENDMLVISVIRKTNDAFKEGVLKYNGRGKYDGHTLNPTEIISTKFDGRHKYNRAIKYSGQERIAADSYVRVPFKYRPGIIDQLDVEIGRHFTDEVKGRIKYNSTIKFDGSFKYSGFGDNSIYDFALRIKPNINYSEAQNVTENQGLRVVAKPDERFSTRQRYDRYFKFDGNIKYNAQREVFSIAGDTFSISDTENMAETVNIGKRYYRKFNGQYRFGGEIKYNGGVFIPLQEE